MVIQKCIYRVDSKPELFLEMLTRGGRQTTVLDTEDKESQQY